jgi:hypothetical protein
MALATAPLRPNKAKAICTSLGSKTARMSWNADGIWSSAPVSDEPMGSQ